MDITLIAGIIAGLVLVVVALLFLVTRYYFRVPPSEVLVIYGSGASRVITNGGGWVKPFIETYKKLDLTIMTIKTLGDEVYTVSGVPIRLDWVAQVQIDSEESALRTAAKAFLDKTRDEVRGVIEETLSANFRAIVGQMTVEAIHRDRDSFVRNVEELAADDLAAMGVKIIAMGIEQITDGEGYLEAMAAPDIAAIKRDAAIAQAEADRMARVKAAEAMREAEQAELNAQREILAQREALQLREVEVNQKVNQAQADSDQEVQRRRALAVKEQQEAEVLVPARAEREAVEIRAEAERRRVTINAEADAEAVRQKAEAEAGATQKRGAADASAVQAMKQAEAEGIRANLLAEAEGRRELAIASAAEGEINLRQFVIEQITNADIQKVRAIAEAVAGLGNNTRIVQFSGQNGSGTGNTLMDLLMNIPELAQVLSAKVEALSGDDLETTIKKAGALLRMLREDEEAEVIPTTPQVTIDVEDVDKQDKPKPKK